MAELKLIQMLERQEALIKRTDRDKEHRSNTMQSDSSKDQALLFRTEPPLANHRSNTMQSDSSKDQAFLFRTEPPSANHRSDTMESDSSKDKALLFRTEPPSANHRSDTMQSDSSKDQAFLFKMEPPSANHKNKEMRPVSEELKDQNSMMARIFFKDGRPASNLSLDEAEFVQSGPEREDSVTVFQNLEENIIRFVKTELMRFQKILTSDDQESSSVEKDDKAEVRDAFLKITMNFLRTMKQDKMADLLIHRQNISKCRCELKSTLQRRFSQVSEGVATAESPAPLQQIYTDLHITEGGAAEFNQEHEVRQIEAQGLSRAETPICCEHIFKGSSDRPIRTLMTVGVAGVGKTVLTQKFSLDWAEDRSNQDVHLLFPFSFRALNVLKDTSFSLVQLIHHFFRQTEQVRSFEHLQVLFIFDGLDECRLPLDFHQTRVLTEPTETASVEELLVNLIRGDLLPSARLWITTRPTASNQIPAECVSMVTEVRGFTDEQREQYFRKRFTDELQATAIISHIRSIHSLYIMCYIPIFCWILSKVLENLLRNKEETELPRTLTNLYIHLLVVLLKQKNVKYDGKLESSSVWSPENKKMVQSLGKLAFEQLQKGNLIFYESDLSECGLDASVYSGMLTEVFREEPGLYQDRVYCFIHLSVQGFLAALHIHQTFINTGTNLLLETRSVLHRSSIRSLNPNIDSVHCRAVDLALQSPNGHLDLLLRFLLGLSLEENQRLLKGLFTTGGISKTSPKTINYIKQKLNEVVSPERSLNLLHCLNELNDHSLLQQTLSWMRAGRVCDRYVSPAQWTALSFILLSSHSDLQHFDLTRFCPEERALLGLMPVVRASTSATLSLCGLSSLSCAPLASVLSSSSLTQLDLSNNNLQDSGVKALCLGLESASCRLQTLSLSGCLVSEEGCKHLSSALKSNPSHLRQLDLSYNHPGETGTQLLQALTEDHRCRLDSLRLEPCGQRWLKPGLRKYSQELTWDLNSVHPHLRLSDSQIAVMYVDDEQPYPKHHDRFDWFSQVLCDQELSGRCYFQVQWSGAVLVGVAYRGLQRKGRHAEAVLGGNAESWCLSCSNRGFSVWHRDQETLLRQAPGSHSVGVLVDTEAGHLSFFSVSDRPTLLHSFSTVFSQPLVPAFGFRFESIGSTVILCPAQEHNNSLTKI